MTSRRDMILGGACLLGAGAALALKPRRTVTLMPAGKKLADILPRTIGVWQSRDVSDLFAPQTPDSLLAELYGETVGRLFSRPDLDLQIMMLMAHGNSQSNELQLHRPEICYPAFGYAIVQSQPIELSIGSGVTLPGRRMIAQSAQDKEAVIYWTRLGEYFPTSVTEQRLDRLDTAVHRYIPDGLLARFSVSGSDTASSFRIMRNFVSELVLYVAGDLRAPLIGTERARRMASAGRSGGKA
jgi:EpsI family protein